MSKEFYDTLKKLTVLQSLDNALLSIESARKTLTEKITQLNGQKISNMEKFSRAKSQLTAKELQLRQLETDLKQHENLAAKLKSDMNGVKSSDVYAALESELKRAAQKADALQTDILNAIESIEKSKPVLAGFEKQVAQKNTEKDEEILVLEKDLLNLAGQETPLKEKIAAAEKNIDEKALNIYKNIRARKDDYSAITEAYIRNNDGVCKACNMKLNSQQILELTRNNSFVYCQNCHRILFDPLLLR